ncbi:type VII secretion protein EccB [Cryptosporangium phraense]|uniref:Type VII secretion protein EccB n=1 Tax=Cryptosporangium phraense TaxID=2593070 RepID=A0A545AR53_9ACTN|nr:type VII secretion protein EccB [Cryptosporangium phraense]TQS43816.1 type VII secretion protein EccB [Cryptosporangium phraense]
MASRKDQLQSYQFLVQRFVSALIMRETDPAQVPFRRLAGAAFASIMVAVLALAGVGIYGLFRPGGDTSWQNGQAIVVEKETGTKFVVIEGTLHPVANYVSAVLIQGSTQTNSVSRKSLVGYPRGARLGIADAPDSLPDVDQLLGSPWSLCMQQQKDAAGADVPAGVLGVGVAPIGGHPLARKGVVAQERGSGDFWLITNDHRYPITDSKAVLKGLGFAQQAPLPVTRAWLGAIPAGGGLAPLDLADIGNSSNARPDARIGQIFSAKPGNNAAPAFYVATATELQSITPLQKDIQIADDATNAAYPDGNPTPIEIPVSDAPDPKPADTSDDAPPVAAPDADTQVSPKSATCATFSTADGTPTIVVDSEPLKSSATAALPASTDGEALADRIDVEPGRAALVRALSSPTAGDGTSYLVTDDGRAHPLASADVAATLGYGTVRPVDLPSSLVARLPVGSALDPKAATKPVPSN